MVKRTLFFAAVVLLVAGSALAYVPRFPVNQVSVKTGETISVPVQAVFSGLDVTFNTWNWVFYSADENVAIVEGSLQNPVSQGFVSITGVGPGDTYVQIGRNGNWPWLRIHVDCSREPGVLAARPVIAATQGQTVALQAISQAPTRTVFQWYAGRVADVSHPMTDGGAGSELSFAVQSPGTSYVWVVARTLCTESIAEFRLDVTPVRRRSARH